MGAITGGVWPAVLAGVGAAVLGVALWVGLQKLQGSWLLAPPLTGLLVGGAVRLFKPAYHKVTWAAVGLTLLGCVTGFCGGDDVRDSVGVGRRTGGPRRGWVHRW